MFACLTGSEYSHMHSTISPAKLSTQPKDDGLWLIDINTKNAKLLISIHDLSQHLHRGTFSWSRDPVTGLPYNTTTGLPAHNSIQTCNAKHSLLLVYSRRCQHTDQALKVHEHFVASYSYVALLVVASVHFTPSTFVHVDSGMLHETSSGL